MTLASLCEISNQIAVTHDGLAEVAQRARAVVVAGDGLAGDGLTEVAPAGDGADMRLIAADLGRATTLSAARTDNPLAATVRLVERHAGRPLPRGVTLTVTSAIPIASGLGSGAAIAVAVIRALGVLGQLPLTREDVSALAYEIERLHHGTPSGIDNTVITYNMPVYYIKGKPIETFKCGKPFLIVIGDTGVPAPTKESVGDVRRLWQRDTNHFENIFNEVAQISTMARHFIESGRPEHLGELMDHNHEFLTTFFIFSAISCSSRSTCLAIFCLAVCTAVSNAALALSSSGRAIQASS